MRRELQQLQQVVQLLFTALMVAMLTPLMLRVSRELVVTPLSMLAVVEPEPLALTLILVLLVGLYSLGEE